MLSRDILIKCLNYRSFYVT